MWFGLCSIADRLLQEAGALKACIEYPSEKSNIFLQISEESLSRQLLLNIAKLFDSAETCGHPNCSILQFRNYFLSTFPNNTNDSAHRILTSLEKLQQTFEVTISRIVRNRKLAHFDLKDLFSFSVVEISFHDLEILILDLISTLSAIATFLSVPHYPFVSISEYSQIYNKAIHSL